MAFSSPNSDREYVLSSLNVLIHYLLLLLSGFMVELNYEVASVQYCH